MTKKEAKELTMEVWEYLRDHPELSLKCELPPALFKQILYLHNDCPLCELFNDSELDYDDWEEKNCMGCPLKEAEHQCNTERGTSHYSMWMEANIKEDAEGVRAKSAAGIVEIVRNWNIEE